MTFEGERVGELVRENEGKDGRKAGESSSRRVEEWREGEAHLGGLGLESEDLDFPIGRSERENRN